MSDGHFDIALTFDVLVLLFETESITIKTRIITRHKDKKVIKLVITSKPSHTVLVGYE